MRGNEVQFRVWQSLWTQGQNWTSVSSTTSSSAASRGELWMSKKCEIDWPSCPRNEALCMAVLWHSYSCAGHQIFSSINLWYLSLNASILSSKNTIYELFWLKEIIRWSMVYCLLHTTLGQSHHKHLFWSNLNLLDSPHNLRFCVPGQNWPYLCTAEMIPKLLLLLTQLLTKSVGDKELITLCPWDFPSISRTTNFAWFFLGTPSAGFPV